MPHHLHVCAPSFHLLWGKGSVIADKEGNLERYLGYLRLPAIGRWH